VALDDLIARARLESGLRANAYYDNDQIVRYLDAGGAELADIFTAANQHYVIKEFDFTTTGGSAAAIVSLPSDFQQGHSLEIYPQTYNGVSTPNQQTRTIRYLPNWLNRNAYAGNAFPLVIAGGGFVDPVYTFLDAKLRFYPPQLTPAAPFKLYYTPQWTTLAAKRTFTVDPSDNPAGPDWSFANGAFTSADIGATVTPAFAAPNTAFNIAYTITNVLSPTFIAVTPTPAGGFTGPASGTATVATAGTTDTIPAVMAPWSEYLVVYAAIAINTDRERGTGELERKLNALKARITSIIAVRQEEPQQPPLSRGGAGWGDGWGGGGWGGGWY